MKTTYAIEDVDNVNVSLTITMRVKEWKKLSEQLDKVTETGPARDFSWKLGYAVRDITQRYMPDVERGGDEQK